jgi:hypothetical protein
MSIDQYELGNGQIEDDQDFAVDITLIVLAGVGSLAACRCIEVVQKLAKQNPMIGKGTPAAIENTTPAARFSNSSFEGLPATSSL